MGSWTLRELRERACHVIVVVHCTLLIIFVVLYHYNMMPTSPPSTLIVSSTSRPSSKHHLQYVPENPLAHPKHAMSTLSACRHLQIQVSNMQHSKYPQHVTSPLSLSLSRCRGCAIMHLVVTWTAPLAQNLPRAALRAARMLYSIRYNVVTIQSICNHYASVIIPSTWGPGNLVVCCWNLGPVQAWPAVFTQLVFRVTTRLC